MFRRKGSLRASRRSPRGSGGGSGTVFECLLDGLVVVDRSGSIKFFNAAAEQLFGYAAAEVVDCKLDMLLSRSGTGRLLDDMVSDTATITGESRIVTGTKKDGAQLTVRLSVSAADSGEDELVIGLVEVGQESKDAEQALREADSHKDEFLAMLGHELRNPLAPLSAGLELLEHTDFEPQVVKKVHAMMGRQLSHLVRLVDDLLDVSRISRGIIEVQREALDLRAVLENAVELIGPFIAERGHDLQVDVGTDPLPVDGDFQRLTQAIGNLLSNAARYTEPGGTVNLRASAVGHHAAVSVKDTGFGIPAERLPSLFGMFSQVPEHKARTGGGGLGIGLALAQQLITLHGGTIEARSDGLGLGSEFVVRVPLAAPSADKAASELEHVSATSRRVLIVDDNRDAAETLRMVLELKGHHVETAFDGTTALHAVERIRPDVVLLDIGLPEMNGYEVGRRMKAMSFGRDVRLFALTGWGQEHDKQQARDAGFDEHLTKPVDLEQLSMLLSSY